MITAADHSFSGSYDPADVTFLLKPVTLATTDIATKEALIQSGARHYSEMLSPEMLPDETYMQLYRAALARNGARLADDVAALAAAIAAQYDGPITLISLVRAGTPIGILLRRALVRMGRDVAHYSISIIRDRGIDDLALAYIVARHSSASIVFVDGWTGKGAIAEELRHCLRGNAFGVVPRLAVIADPAGVADFAATHDDYLIASGLLNSIVSGLVSRSILNADVVGSGDFHACVYYQEFEPDDLSRAFIATIDGLVPDCAAAPPPRDAALASQCQTLIDTIMAASGTRDRNRIKPGIAEATRAVLRRMPHSLWLRDAHDPDVAHLLHLSRTHAMPVNDLPADCQYRAIAVIKTLGSE